MLQCKTGINAGHIHVFMLKSVPVTKNAVFVGMCGYHLLVDIYAILHLPFTPPAPQHPRSSFVVVTPLETGTGLTLGDGA